MGKVCSIFSQLLQLSPRVEFERLVRETRAAMGEPFTPIPELEERSEVVEHIEKLVKRTGADLETLLKVADGMFIYLRRLENLSAENP